MDNQQSMPNTPAGNERPGAVTPENLQVGAAPEVKPAGAPAAPETAPGGANVAGQGAQPKLSAADVAKVIAATPTVGAVPPVQGPATADDVDVIEPEWVAKAEEVIKAHQGDPYNEEEAIEDLQEDYLQKRYGITVAKPDASGDKPKAA